MVCAPMNALLFVLDGSALRWLWCVSYCLNWRNCVHVCVCSVVSWWNEDWHRWLWSFWRMWWIMMTSGVPQWTWHLDLLKSNLPVSGLLTLERGQHSDVILCSVELWTLCHIWSVTAVWFARYESLLAWENRQTLCEISVVMLSVRTRIFFFNMLLSLV